MRLLLLVLTSCAASLPPPTEPLRYDCSDRTYTRAGDTLASGSAALALKIRGEELDLFTASQLEVSLPHDRRRDATERVVLGLPSSVHTEVCRVEGGISDLTIRYLGGESLDQLAREHTGGDRAAAYELIHQGMLDLQRHLSADR